MSVAQLGFQIDSSQAAGAAADLDKLTSAAARTEQAATKVSGAGTRMSRGFADLNPALDKIIGSLGRLEGIATSIDKRLDMMASAATRAAKANGVLDQSAVEASTAYKQLEASLNAVTAAQRKADAAQAGSLAMIDKQKAAIASLRAEIAKLQNTPMPGQPNNPNVPRPANNNGQFQTSNIAAQLFDIGSTAAFMNPTTVGLQQGPQLAQAFAGQSAKQALTGLAAGLSAIASPVSLIAIGLTTAAAAAIQFGSNLASSSSKAQKALEGHEDTIKRIRALYDEGLDTRGSGFGQYTQAQISFLTNRDKFLLNNSMTTQLKGIGNSLGPRTGGRDSDDLASAILSGGQTGDPAFQLALKGLQSQYGATADAVLKFSESARTGKADVLGFNEEIIKIANQDPANEKLQKIVRDLLEMTKGASDAAAALRETGNELDKISRSYSQWDMQSGRNASKYQADQEYARLAMTRRYNADIANIGARSPSQMGAAERRRLEAEPIDPLESPGNRSTRIDQRVDLITKQAQFQLDEAKRERSRSLDKTLKDQQSEIDLIGKTGGAAAALRKEYELTSALRMEAARQGIEVDQRELDLIKERAAALGELTDLYNQRRFDFEMGQQSGDARMSARDRQIVTTLRQYGLPEDLGSANAQRIGQQYDWQQAKDMAKGFGSAFSSELVSGSHDIGKAFLKGFEASLENQANKLWEKFFDGFGNLFADWLTGKSGSGSGGAIGSVVSAIGGSRAANDNTSGAFSGLGKLTSVTRSALPDVAATGNIADYIRNAAIKRGIDPNTALKVAQSEGGLNSWNLQSSYYKNGVREQSYGPFQLYKGGGLGNSFMDKTGLDPALAANGPAATDFALDHAAKNGWGAWYGAAKVGVGKWDGIGTGGTATDAVNKLAEAAGSATKGLDTFGGGLGKIGETLSTNFFPAAPSAPSGGGGGGGLFGWLGGLFSPNLSKYAGLTGLFADGTNYAPGGLAIVGERGPELVNLPQGSQVFDTNRSARMMGGGREGGGNQRPIQNFYLDGARGDDHIRELARQGAAEGIAQYNERQINGGFGDNQKQYQSRVA